MYWATYTDARPKHEHKHVILHAASNRYIQLHNVCTVSFSAKLNMYTRTLGENVNNLRNSTLESVMKKQNILRCLDFETLPKHHADDLLSPNISIRMALAGLSRSKRWKLKSCHPVHCWGRVLNSKYGSMKNYSPKFIHHCYWPWTRSWGVSLMDHRTILRMVQLTSVTLVCKPSWYRLVHVR